MSEERVSYILTGIVIIAVIVTIALLVWRNAPPSISTHNVTPTLTVPPSSGGVPANSGSVPSATGSSSVQYHAPIGPTYTQMPLPSPRLSSPTPTSSFSPQGNTKTSPTK